MGKITELFSLAGKTAIVTGASHGLGVTFAEALAQQGAKLVLAARSEDKLKAVCDKLNAAGHEAIAVKCDVSDSAQVKGLMEAAIARCGRIDVLVNNAGTAAETTVPERVTDESFLATVQVNLMGVWYCCHHAAQSMLADGKGGSIINIASVAGLWGTGNFYPAYQATKGAVINLTRSLACSWADRGVRVNALCPGWFPSELTLPAFALPGFMDWVTQMAPMGRIGNPEELAGPLVFLASDASSFMTGHALAIDGGITAGTERVPEVTLNALQAAGLGELARPIRPVKAEGV